MLSIKIEIGWNKAHRERKKAPDIKKTVWLAALLDSVVWIADTALLLKVFYAMPLCPLGICFILGVLLLYFGYFIVKTKLLSKKYGKDVCQKEFGHTGMLLAAVSVVLLFILVMIDNA